MPNQATADVLDFEELETSFNDSLDELRKSLGVEETDDETPDEEQLEKAGDSKAKKAMDMEDEAEESEDEDEEDEEDEGDYKKSIEYELSQEPEAEAAMDVSPFLRELVKSIDRRFNAMEKSVGTVATLAKSIGKAQLSQMELSKSMGETVNRVATEDQRVAGLRRLNKSRFEGDTRTPVEVDGQTVLEKSQSWLKDGKIDINEAGMIEYRVNRGSLGNAKDQLDRKVAQMLQKEAE